MFTLRSALALLIAAASLPDPASAQYFGRNKVQYRAFDFDIIRTEHFDVYYYSEERTAALDAARMVERSYGRLAHVLQHDFEKRKPLILYASHADFQQTNTLSGLIDESTGGVTESAKSRMILPFTGDYASFDHVLTHELVHGFQFDVILNGAAAGGGGAGVARLPLWFMEGMAEYLSIGHVDAHTESWLRDAVLSGYIRTIDDMTMRDDYLSYRFGQSLWAYIGATWGDEVVGILLEKAPLLGIERAFVGTLGVTLDELSDAWLASIRTKYLPQLADRERPDGFAQRLTAHDELRDPWYLSPAISPDGERMVFLSQRDGYHFDLWLADARTGHVIARLIEGARDAGFESLRYMRSSAAFSPDGRFIAFAAQNEGRDVLYVYDVARRRVVRKLRFELNGLSNPTWSPDGHRLVFTGLDGGLSDLFVTDLQGRLERLTSDRYAELHPAWSPDGRSIAFATDRGPATDMDRLGYGNLRVALYTFDDGSITVLPHQDEGKNVNPVWSPDGESLVWVSDRSGTNDIYHFELDARRLVRLTQLLSGVIAIGPLSPVLSWSRSDRLLFTYFEKAGYNIYGVDDPRSLGTRADRPPALVASADASGGGAGQDPRMGAGRHVSPLPASAAALAGSALSDSLGRGTSPGPSIPMVTNDDDAGPPNAGAADPPALGRISVSALLDSASRVLPDTSTFEMRDYKVSFSADAIGQPGVGVQVGGAAGTGMYGGSYIALSDMLGNHNIVLAGNLNGSLADATFFSGYSFLKRRANMEVAFLQQPLYRYLGGGYDIPMQVDGETQSVAANVFLRDVVRGASVGMSYPFDQFMRLEVATAGYRYTTDLLYRGIVLASGEPFDVTQTVDGFGYWQPQAALVMDNARFGWTGPIDGRRFRIQLSRYLGDLQFTEALLDLRNYFGLGEERVLASRLIGLVRSGPSADRFSIFWGGAGFLRGYDGGSFDVDSEECEAGRSTLADRGLSYCPIRDQLIGSSAAVLNTEVRLPVLRTLELGGLGRLPPLDAVGFFDAGIAWDNRICARTDPLVPTRCAETSAQPVRRTWRRDADQDPLFHRRPLFSYGVGLRMNIYYTVIRLDYAVPLNRPAHSGITEGIWSFSFGPSF